MNLQLRLWSQKERESEREGEVVCMCIPRSIFVRALSMHLFIHTSECLRIFIYVLRGSPNSTWGESSLSSITRGKWNTFVSGCSVVRGGQINVFN